MSNTLLAVVAVLYLGVAIGYALKHNYGMCLAFVAYAIANLGFMWASA